MRAHLTYIFFVLALVVACPSMRASDTSSTLSSVRASGVLRCGINVEEAESSTSDDHGNRRAFDLDVCRAVAEAVLGKRAKVSTSDYPDDRTSMEALRRGEVEIIPTLTDDFTHSAGTQIQFTRPVLWDGVGFLIPANSRVTLARQLSGRKICFLAETAVEESVRSWFAHNDLSFVPFPFQEEGEMQAAFATGNCGALAGDQTRLAQIREALAQNHEWSRLLPEQITKDPLAAAYRAGDPQWAAIVNWVMEVLIQAEESGVTQANVDRLRTVSSGPGSDDPALRFMLGGSHEIGSKLGLDDDWAVHVIDATGNYGEMFDRDLGRASNLKLPRGANKLLSKGGSMVALPAK